MADPGPSALLPAGMMDGLPPAAAVEAEAVERLIRSFAGFGYERVKPPLIEFEDTLLAGSGAALAPQTFRLMDPVSQRMLALRPDMTLQVARIAASRLSAQPRPLRLSYAGQVVRVRGSQVRPQRQFGQVGAELIGAAALTADVEVIVMAASALADLGVGGLSVDLGLPAFIPAILADRPIAEAIRTRLRIVLDRKDAAAVQALAPQLGRETADLLARMVTICGPAEQVLAKFRHAQLPPSARVQFQSLIAVTQGLRKAASDLTVTIDLVEWRGFEYHSGVTLALFAREVTGDLGRGGRYRTGDGEDATGITLFMDKVMEAVPSASCPFRVFLPYGTGVAEGGALRRAGWITVAGLAALDGEAATRAEATRLGCSHLWIAGEARALFRDTGGQTDSMED